MSLQKNRKSFTCSRVIVFFLISCGFSKSNEELFRELANLELLLYVSNMIATETFNKYNFK